MRTAERLLRCCLPCLWLRESCGSRRRLWSCAQDAGVDAPVKREYPRAAADVKMSL